MIDCGWCTGSPEPDLVLRTHFHSSSKRITGIVDKEIDAVLDKEHNAASIEERKEDPPDRNAFRPSPGKAPALALSHRSLSTLTARSWKVYTSIQMVKARHDKGHAGLTIYRAGRIAPACPIPRSMKCKGSSSRVDPGIPGQT